MTGGTQSYTLSMQPPEQKILGISALRCRFFCGPNAKKSAALAKQQKKRPRGDDRGKGKRAAADSEGDSAATDSGAHSSAFPNHVAQCCYIHPQVQSCGSPMGPLQAAFA